MHVGTALYPGLWEVGRVHQGGRGSTAPPGIALLLLGRIAHMLGLLHSLLLLLPLISPLLLALLFVSIAQLTSKLL